MQNKKKMTINEWLKRMKEAFPTMSYKATSKQGQVFKSKHWKDEKN